MSNLMAGFGPDFVETQILSETNSVTYRITAKATHPNAVPNQYEFTLNQKAVGTPPSVGINVWRINNSVVDPIKTFTLSNDNSATANKAFVEYMDAQPSGLYLIMTNGEYKTSQIVDDWFAKNRSVMWQGADFAQRFPNSAYVALYGASKSRILIESFYANDGVLKEDSRASIDLVYDNVGDVGRTGVPFRSVEDTEEYNSTNGSEYKVYPVTNPVISKLADYGMAPGLAMMITGDFYASKALLDAGSTTRVTVRWFTGTAQTSSSVIEVPANKPDEWLRFEQFYTIPSGCDGFNVAVSRYPKPATDSLSAIRNFVMVQVSAAEADQNFAAQFGVNGIRMNNMIDGGTPYIFELPNTKVYPGGDYSASEFREVDA